MQQTTTLELLPDPQRMIEGLRDTGYEFNTAMADIIDNSIAANASEVIVTVNMTFRGKIRIAIADNGTGMDRDGLLNAMKYGSKRRDNAASLGKFGLGLKTASTAFCRKLSVVSRDKAESDFLRATWDLDHVSKVGKWELIVAEPESEMLEFLTPISNAPSGTVVFWDSVDRLIKNYDDPAGKPAQNALKKKIDELKEHLSMVYQRFLDTADNRAPNVKIFVNSNVGGAKTNEQLPSWDPFCIKESELAASEDQPVETEKGEEATFSVKAFILPRREEFSTPEAAKIAKLNNDMQGIYIYRENRLIHSADWLGMFTKEPHGSLLRVEFSFDHRLDDAFHIDIKKSQIILDQELWNWLKDQFLTAPRREANNRYRQGQNKKAMEKAEGSHDTSNRTIGSKEQEVDSTSIEVLNPDNGECQVQNKKGKFKFKFKLTQKLKPGEVFIQPVQSLDDNVLFQPALIEGHKSVQINTSHPFYHKVYVPNLSKGVTIQGMDSLFWAMSVAELNCSNENTLKHFDEVRFEISRVLRTLVEDLPEPEMDSNESE